MARKREKLRYEPMYKPRSQEKRPRKRKRMWQTVLRILTLGLVGGQHRVALKTKEKQA